MADAPTGAGHLAPDVGFVEPMLRRRLSALARMSLRVAHDCLPEPRQLRLVYASRHGELNRTTGMLESIAEQETLSPTAFGMSVLNASSGLFSILQHNTAPATAISAGCSSFGYGLLEACLQLAEDPQQAVLFVYADEPAPERYSETERPGSAAHAIALLLDRQACQQGIELSVRDTTTAPSDEVQSRAFLRCLEQGRADWSDGARIWSWTQAE